MDTSTHFFLGANSGQGFRDLFGRFCAPEAFDDLLVLKGSAGCGKSTMMRRIGEAMEARGEEVEYLHCSGDPDSLDGVHIPRLRAAVVDGTAPHVIEPQYPAAVERYADLGAYWDVAAIKREREAVVHWTDTCSAAYQRAYRALGAARQMEDSAAALAAEGMDYDKLQRRTDGILARELRGKGGGGPDRWRFLGSLTCRGPVWRFDSAAALCPRIYLLQDSYGLAWPMMERLRAAAGARGYRAVVCPSPEHPERIEHLLLPELGLAFVTSREGMVWDGPVYRRIRVDAMIPSAYSRRFRSRLRFTGRMVQVLREEGTEALREAKAAHDRLEAVYCPHVDFEGVSARTAVEIAGLERRLEELDGEGPL